MSKIIKVCPECGEPTKPGRIPCTGWALTVPGKHLENVHSADGTPLCPVMGHLTNGASGYVPALPERRRAVTRWEAL